LKTELTNSVQSAARYIAEGEVVAFPTETVYGLGASVFNKAAIAKIFAAKGRPGDNPLIAHIATVEQLDTLAREIPRAARLLIDRFFPGPLTVILPKRPEVPLIATAGLETIGVRMPDHPLAIELLRACGVPLVAPSANLSGRPSPTTWQAVLEDLDGRIACILKGEPTRVGLESTVVDCTSDVPTVLRAGAITVELLQTVIPEIALSDQHTPTAPKSTGMKYRHYSPHARIVLCHTPTAILLTDRTAYIGIDPPHNPQDFAGVLLCLEVDDYARQVFQFFRECDAAGIETIFCQTVEREGLGLALMDRLEKAAHH
jgi:L-threonylcarbamoyladenylate synthase